ncbi:beta-ketoacyl synthase N-terminal-like domain-containing protein [Litorilituus lipolyticus]|uniref:Ketosynthase family 3 (KS3) domain-containing protein n=1 Tax=Litorilituus lipolyticus TaxID=2491017 RepID=A0A502KRI3_9GAMM|nr:beta-ketoacyl synthase N-terminal-like domain-containing protein [Litorilituus lipolyticus]TPH12223.1 hypothetical protein EPA86_17935 [Litorilituus lipolyticus]
MQEKTQSKEQQVMEDDGTYIHDVAAVSSLGHGIASLDLFSHSQLAQTIEKPIPCLFHALPLFAVEQRKNDLYIILSQVVSQLIERLSLTQEQLRETSLFLGSSSLDIVNVQSDENRVIWLSTLDKINLYLVEKFKLNALHFTFNTACTSSSNAVIYANRLLKSKQVKYALVVGCEFYNELTLRGFMSLELLSDRALFAFSQQRDGMVLGEGVGALFLSSQAKINNSKPLLQVLDGYSSCDTYSLTSTQEDGNKIVEVINRALALSNLTIEDIDVVKVHGTASPASDQAEAQALKSFALEEKKLFALKPFIGHTLGACGALELALLVQLIKLNKIPVSEYMTEHELILPILSTQISFENVNYILTNHCGFGGNNAAIVLKKLSYLESTFFSDKQPIIESNTVSTLNIIAQHQLAISNDMPTKAVRKQVKQVTGFEVRRMDSFTLIALQTIHEMITQLAVDYELQGKPFHLTQYNLGLYSVADYFSVELLQSLIVDCEKGEEVRPLDFISTVGNAANFYIAKQFQVNGVNIFTGASEHALENITSLASYDLSHDIVDMAIIVHWQQQANSLECFTQLITNK